MLEIASFAHMQKKKKLINFCCSSNTFIGAQYALFVRNLPSLRGLEGIQKLSNDISTEGNRSARFVGIVYGSKMTKG